MENGSKREKSFSDKIAEVEQDYQIGVRLICGSVGIIFTVLAAAGYDYYANSHLIAKIPKTKYQSVLIKTGVASTADLLTQLNRPLIAKLKNFMRQTGT